MLHFLYGPDPLGYGLWSMGVDGGWDGSTVCSSSSCCILMGSMLSVFLEGAHGGHTKCAFNWGDERTWNFFYLLKLAYCLFLCRIAYLFKINIFINQHTLFSFWASFLLQLHQTMFLSCRPKLSSDTCLFSDLCSLGGWGRTCSWFFLVGEFNNVMNALASEQVLHKWCVCLKVSIAVKISIIELSRLSVLGSFRNWQMHPAERGVWNRLTDDRNIDVTLWSGNEAIRLLVTYRPRHVWAWLWPTIFHIYDRKLRLALKIQKSTGQFRIVFK